MCKSEGSEEGTEGGWLQIPRTTACQAAVMSGSVVLLQKRNVLISKAPVPTNCREDRAAERWPQSTLAGALRRVGPVLHLGSTVDRWREATTKSWARESRPYYLSVMRCRGQWKDALSLTPHPLTLEHKSWFCPSPTAAALRRVGTAPHLGTVGAGMRESALKE